MFQYVEVRCRHRENKRTQLPTIPETGRNFPMHKERRKNCSAKKREKSQHNNGKKNIERTL